MHRTNISTKTFNGMILFSLLCVFATAKPLPAFAYDSVIETNSIASQPISPATEAPSTPEASVSPGQTAGSSSQSEAPKPEGETRAVSMKSLIPNILSDEKLVALYPFHIMEGKHFKHIGPALMLAGVTAGLIALDPHDTPYFRNHSGFNSYRTGALGEG